MDAHPIQTAFRPYADAIAGMLANCQAAVPSAAEPGVLPLEAGTLFPRLLIDPAAPVADHVAAMLILDRPLEGVRVVDRHGHRRPLYRPLLVYASLQAFRIAYDSAPADEWSRWESALRLWSDVLAADLAPAVADRSFPAARGDVLAAAAFDALALGLAGRVLQRESLADLASAFFGALAAAQQGTGAFLTTSASDNPELAWYHELALLHAAASHAVQAEDRPLARAVARAAEFHLRETQPDHATAHPLALFAFLWHEPARPLADQVLHTVATLRPEGVEGVSAILLADALLCVRLFLGEDRGEKIEDRG